MDINLKFVSKNKHFRCTFLVYFAIAVNEVNNLTYVQNY